MLHSICHVRDACLRYAHAKMGLPAPSMGMEAVQPGPEEDKPVLLAKHSRVRRQVQSSRHWEARLACIINSPGRVSPCASPGLSDISATCLALQFHSQVEVETAGVVIEELPGNEPQLGHFMGYLPGQASSSGIDRASALPQGPLLAEEARPCQQGPLAQEHVQNRAEPPRKRLRGKQPRVPLQASSRKNRQPL